MTAGDFEVLIRDRGAKWGLFMKRLSCRDLGGPCDAEFAGESFAEIGKKGTPTSWSKCKRAKRHTLSQNTATPEQQQAMTAEFKRKFDEAPDV